MGISGGGQALGRYAHYLGGITWIGLLYFFNFIQGAVWRNGDSARGEALRKITWRTLWWFRWEQSFWVSGIWILVHQELIHEVDYWRSVWYGNIFEPFRHDNGCKCLMVIWPAQKIAIGLQSQ